MSFLVYFNLQEFLQATIKDGNTIYCAAYSLTGKSDGFVLLTSDAGVSGGSIHAVQITIVAGDSPTESATDLAREAVHKFAKFLKAKGIIVGLGVFLTTGLQEAIKYWGNVTRYSLSNLEKELEEALRRR
jgi:hypothetical protein